MLWSGQRARWGYPCTSCGSNRYSQKDVFIVNAQGIAEDLESPCTGAEYFSLKKELLERNAQRDNLVFKIKELNDNNKKYRERLEQRESSKQKQLHVLQKTHKTQLSDRDHLISSLQTIIQDHEKTIQQLKDQVHGQNDIAPSTPSTTTSSCAVITSPFATAGITTTITSAPPSPTHTTSDSATSHLVSEIQRLQDEKSSLVAQFTEVQMQHTEKITKLQKALADRDKADTAMNEDDKENREQQAANEDAGNCSTDTEKQLEKVQSENRRLLGEVSSLHRFYTRNTLMSYSPQAESQRRLEDDNEQLRRHLSASQTALQSKDLQMKELESDLREEMGMMQTEKQVLERQLGHMKNRLVSAKEEHDERVEISEADTEKSLQHQDLVAKWTLLHAKDPDVVMKVVQIEVERDELKTQVAELQGKVEDWEQRHKDQGKAVNDLHSQIEFVTEKFDKVEEKNRQLWEKVRDAELGQNQAITDARQHLQDEIHQAHQSHQQLLVKAAPVLSSFNSLKQAYLLLCQQVQSFPEMIRLAVKDSTEKMCTAVQEISDRNKDLLTKYQKEIKLRKKYHNELVELKGNIRVFCRVRPTIKEDGTGPQADTVVSYDVDDDRLIHVSNKGRIQTFDFDRVFNTTSTQTEVFDEMKALVTSCIDGFNVCIFAYGQTGSGKTFTMDGPPGNPGINQLALQELFDETADKGDDWVFNIEVSVLEIYNETIRDLLSCDTSNKLDVKMKYEGGGYYVPGLVTKSVSSLQQVNQVFAEGRKNRATATTNMNEHSSRSHCLLCVTVTGFNRITNIRSVGRLNLVDLAGSERVSKSKADGARLKEAQNINKSLACLGDVIHALRAKQSHIPFRNSKLTYLLQESLGGDSKTLMIVQVAPVEKNVSETACSLCFGQRVRTVELGAASRKIETLDLELKSPPPYVNPTNSPPLKRKAMSPTSPVPSSSQPQKCLTNTPNTSSPSIPRVTRQAIRKKPPTAATGQPPS